MLERRRHDRNRSFEAGTIAYGRSHAATDCVVRNLSEGGALLLLDEPRRAPLEVDLASRGGTRTAVVVWRGEAAVGVAFRPVEAVPTPPTATVISLDEARRERGLADDGRRLADRIARYVRPSRGGGPD